MIPPPPTSPLFPYTTLFRSRRRRSTRRENCREYSSLGSVVGHDHALLGLRGVLLAPLWHDREKDRKSTRLNSSHPSISYAVFCLKKKTALTRQSHSQPSFAA